MEAERKLAVVSNNALPLLLCSHCLSFSLRELYGAAFRLCFHCLSI
eukprot:SAG22_NODE_2042_length_3090_cov_9.718823_4_plen_46_part_00